MIIEGNEKEIEAMEQFHKGNRTGRTAVTRRIRSCIQRGI